MASTRSATCRASTSRAATPPSSSSSCCSGRRPSAAFFTGFGIARDYETGFARRYIPAAANRNGIVAGYGVAALFRALVTWAILTIVALVAGMQIDLVNMAATLWAAGVAMRVRSIQGGPLMQLPILLILFLAPVYVPLDLLSDWIHALATVNPVTALLEAGRGFISGDPTVVGLAFAIAIVLPIVFALWSRGGLRSAEAAGWALSDGSHSAG